MRIEEMGTSFHESRTSGWSLFCGLALGQNKTLKRAHGVNQTTKGSGNYR